MGEEWDCEDAKSLENDFILLFLFYHGKTRHDMEKFNYYLSDVWDPETKIEKKCKYANARGSVYITKLKGNSS